MSPKFAIALRISAILDQSCLVTGHTKQTVHDVQTPMNQSLTVHHYVIHVMQSVKREGRQIIKVRAEFF